MINSDSLFLGILYRWLLRKKKLLTFAVTAFKVYYPPKYLHDPPSLALLHPMCSRDGIRLGYRRQLCLYAHCVVAAHRKWKTHLTLWECQEFRHNKNFCYLCCDPVADSHAKLIPSMPVWEAERKRWCDWCTFLGFSFPFRKEVVGWPSDAC